MTLFVYADIGLETFWMQNVLIPLSVAFMGDRGDRPYLHHQKWEVVDIVDMDVAAEPHTGPFPVYKSARPYRCVLEVNQGFFQRHNITVGA